jgi:hypothetical protein
VLDHVDTEKIEGGLRAPRSCHLMRRQSRVSRLPFPSFGNQARSGITTRLRLIRSEKLKARPSNRVVETTAAASDIRSICKFAERLVHVLLYFSQAQYSDFICLVGPFFLLRRGRLAFPGPC